MSATGPLVSCLMATHGRHALVERALTMFLRQDYPARELVILNNHPVPLLGDFPGVRIINEPGYPTLGDCRQRLLQLAEGEYIETYDDDDLHLPNKLSQGVAHLIRNPNVAGWKPSRSWFTHGGKSFSLHGNAMESSILIRTEAARRHGYQPTGGDEHAPLLRGLDNDGLGHRELGAWAGYCYTWGCGAWHISGAIASPVAERTANWVARNQDVRPGVPLQRRDDEVKHLWEQMTGWVEPVELREEWRRRMCGDRPEWEMECPKCEQIEWILRHHPYYAKTPGLQAVECGRMRKGGDEGRDGDGWSTLQFAVHPNVKAIYSIDTNPATEAICRELIPAESLAKVTFGEALGEPRMFDVAYIDASDDPAVNLQCLLHVWRQLQPNAVIAVDDFPFGRKHVLIRALLEPTHAASIVGDAIVFTRRRQPEFMRDFDLG